MGKKKLAPNGQGGHGQIATPSFGASKKSQEKFQQIAAKIKPVSVVGGKQQGNIRKIETMIKPYIPKESRMDEYNRLKREGRTKEYFDKYFPNRKKKDEAKK